MSFLSDLLELRVVVEPRAAALAAARGKASDVVAIREAHDAFRRCSAQGSGWLAAEEVLYSRIAITGGNQIFQQMGSAIRGAISTFRPLVDAPHSAWEEMMRLHSCVVDVIERRDVKSAEAASGAVIEFSISLPNIEAITAAAA
ncbi:FCD domain-containing protein [Burkholderia sp. Ac-20365]|uniref:FadR/GntR family transcriptional regulator n=1 Tax=Burkholderia sp. Ac-20365 TaxID=2703897 RepID=UPI001F119D08|nr:FCD domain-containing protein [Burkholderia sp. Ac-20365]